MSPVTMPQIARRLGVNVEQIGFAARLGRLPQPIGRDRDGLLLFDADQIAKPIEYDLPDEFADFEDDDPVESEGGEI